MYNPSSGKETIEEGRTGSFLRLNLRNETGSGKKRHLSEVFLKKRGGIEKAWKLGRHVRIFGLRLEKEGRRAF